MGHLTKQQQEKIHGMKMQLFLAKVVLEQHGKGSRRLWLGYIMLAARQGCQLYQSVLPKGRRNVP
ncbi:hypothetical protein K492DRAFT_177623 [Lichtheimia hyalospora FSU 10163]|nr:hypothetical protein K492DRAFT_177623 [Lichtheimia hyalospora FSU 10163]